MNGLPEIKFNVGDTVYLAGTTIEQKKHDCPDCLGKRTWHVRSPAGGVYEAPCPRCNVNYQSNNCLSLDYSVVSPVVKALTVGSVQINTNDTDDPVKYMCIETGVGSGTVYYQSRMFPSEAEAMAHAKGMAASKAHTPQWVTERYDASVKFSDYELRPAVAEAEKGRNAVLKWEIHDLREAVRECESMDDLKSLVELWEAN